MQPPLRRASQKELQKVYHNMCWKDCSRLLMVAADVLFSFFKESREGQPRSAAQGSHGGAAQLSVAQGSHGAQLSLAVRRAATSATRKSASLLSAGVTCAQQLPCSLLSWSFMEPHGALDGGPTRAPWRRGPPLPALTLNACSRKMAASNGGDSNE